MTTPTNEQAVPIYREITLRYDLANDRVEYDNPDSMTYLEIMGLIKFAELMMAAEIVKSDE